MANLVEMNATMTCPHQGRIMPSGSAPSARVSLGGQPALKGTAPVYTLPAVRLPPPTEHRSPVPRRNGRSTRPGCESKGMPALLSISTGVTIGPLGMQGAPSVMMSQVRVTGQ